MPAEASAAEREHLVQLARETAAALTRAMGDDGIGLTQFRSLLDACREALAVAEIFALIEYQVGRAKGKGWGAPLDGGKKAGTVVLERAKTLTDRRPGASEREKLDQLALFFGYLYRAAVAQKG